MKNRFIKLLPIAAAILLGTSCSKDDSNQAIDNVATPDPVQAEVVDTPVAKTITISGKASQSLSKVTTTDDVNFAFQGNEAFTFNDETNGVSGTIQFKNGASGDYDATITYTDAAKLTASTGFKAKHGTPPTAMSTAYTSLAAAVQNGYYETEFVVTGSEGAYSLKDQADNTSDINVYVRCAFIKALCNKTAKLDGQDITVAEGKFYVIPSGVVMGSSSKETADGTIYTVKEKKAQNWLSGAFTVDADGTQVYFSKGNLQYTVGTGYKFADNQYDYIGNTSANQKCTGTFDLFCWGTGNNPAQKCVTVSTFDDWGNHIESDNQWFTLSSAQWQYLLGSSTERSGKNGIGTIKVGDQNYLGLIIVPDGYTDPEGVTKNFVSGTTNTAYGESDWLAMEAAGAVFLPAAGYRLETSVNGAGSDGNYWSSTADGASNTSYIVYFNSGNLDPVSYSSRNCGQSVRLVRCMN